MQQSIIPIFFLYGEPQKSADPDFVHIESLAARSVPNDWHIHPHQHADLNHVFLISQGGGTMHFESEVVEFDAPRLLIIPARFVHGFDWHSNSDGIVLTIADVQLLQLTGQYAEFKDLFAQPRCIAVERADIIELMGIMASMTKELSWKVVGQSAAIQAGLLMTLVRALRQLQHATLAGTQSMRQIGLVARYRQMVEHRFHLREPMKTYARALGVSLTTLREACASVGQSPTEIRDQRALLEAQRLLAYSAMTVSEVGDAIGIPDPAYFSRLFSRKCGQAPYHWRQAILAGRRDRALHHQDHIAHIDLA